MVPLYSCGRVLPASFYLAPGYLLRLSPAFTSPHSTCLAPTLYLSRPLCILMRYVSTISHSLCSGAMFRNYPKDFRLSTVCYFVAHFGTLTEFLFPLLLAASSGPILEPAGQWWAQLALFTAISFHVFIFINVAMGAPQVSPYHLTVSCLASFVASVPSPSAPP